MVSASQPAARSWASMRRRVSDSSSWSWWVACWAWCTTARAVGSGRCGGRRLQGLQLGLELGFEAGCFGFGLAGEFEGDGEVS
jgi:hypothetical protein